jgi:thiopeptide-type bacteriocin biosynthesis protein
VGVTDAPDGEWLSAHLFYRGDARVTADQVIARVVRPFVDQARPRGWAQRWFFIRYSHLGPHVRLRLHGRADVLRAEVGPALEAHVAAHLAPELAGQPHESLAALGEPSPTSPALWFIPYEPETVRYGGPRGVLLAEELFFHSSEAALALLESFESGDAEVRFGLALASMVVLLGSLTRDRSRAGEVAHIHRASWVQSAGADGAADVRERFEEGYAQNAEMMEQVEAIWAALDDGPDALPPPLDAYAAGAMEVAARLRALQEAGDLATAHGPVADWPGALRALAPSYLHMMNNRLGVSPREESYLGHLLARAFGAPEAW